MKRANFPGRKLARKLRHLDYLNYTGALPLEQSGGRAALEALLSLPVNNHGRRPHERDARLLEWSTQDPWS